MEVIIYSDGSSRGNPGPGGFGTVLLSSGGHKKEISAGFRKTTNNRMELLGVIAGLEAIKQKGLKVKVISDSKYVVDAVQKGWLKGWVKKGFAGKKNVDLWKRFLEIAPAFDITFQWVKGHAGNTYNERCDVLAVKAATGADLQIDYGYESENAKSGLF